MNSLPNVQHCAADPSMFDRILNFMTSIANFIERHLPDTVTALCRNRAVLLGNLPYWGAVLAATILVVSVVIRPCAQLLCITATYTWNYCVAFEFDLSNNAIKSNNFAMSAEEARLGCNVGVDAAKRALSCLNTEICPVETLRGKPCNAFLRQSKKSNDNFPMKSLSTARHANLKICPTAAPEFQAATRRLINWFNPFHKNGSITCSHTQWFNVSYEVPGVVTSTMFGEPVVLWYPSIINHRKIKTYATGEGGVNRGHKLSLVVFSHISQKEELLTYKSVVEISYFTPIVAKKVTSSNSTPSTGAVMARKNITLTGGMAHCVQWLMDVHG